ncbi:hypothetical protein MF672_046640 [Actinomadura sp. ATCC 31491]|uniref:Uncharacterized protein n=1 Tax=Actinomadura luzonensis TaxID=2805427 RepID=A0ABT0G9H0_9ACTN|nr:hypothetical protein [Actinomadura luzonensis]MCK2221232.1 hypothetical protein [Actinomadura luzonensis]
MAMPGKGSRLITVDGAVYRWRVRPKPTRRDGRAWRALTFAVEAASGAGRPLLVSLPCARPDNGLEARTIVVRPALVASCVRRALGQGWDPAGTSSGAFRLTLTEDELTELLGEPPRYLVPFLWGMIPEGGGIADLPRCVQIRPA